MNYNASERWLCALTLEYRFKIALFAWAGKEIAPLEIGRARRLHSLTQVGSGYFILFYFILLCQIVFLASLIDFSETLNIELTMPS
jgi:hypothetical protein